MKTIVWTQYFHCVFSDIKTQTFENAFVWTFQTLRNLSQNISVRQKEITQQFFVSIDVESEIKIGKSGASCFLGVSCVHAKNNDLLVKRAMDLWIDPLEGF